MIEIEAKALKEMVSMSSALVNPRHANNVLTGLEISVAGSDLMVTGSDGKNILQLTGSCINVDGDNWRAVVPMTELKTLLKPFKGRVKITEQDNKLTFEVGASKGVISLLKEDYPKNLAAIEWKPVCEWRENEIDFKLSELAVFRQYCSDSNTLFNGIWLDWQDDKINFVATNGYSMAWRLTSLDSERFGYYGQDLQQRALKFDPNFSKALYPVRKAETIRQLSVLLAPDNCPYVLFETLYNGHVVHVMGCLEKYYYQHHLVNWRDVIPETTAALFFVSSVVLKETLKTFPIRADSWVSLSLTGETLKLTTPVLETSLPITCKSLVDDKITVNVKDFLTIVSDLTDGSELEIAYNQGFSPIRISRVNGASVRYVTMPKNPKN